MAEIIHFTEIGTTAFYRPALYTPDSEGGYWSFDPIDNKAVEFSLVVLDRKVTISLSHKPRSLAGPRSCKMGLFIIRKRNDLSVASVESRCPTDEWERTSIELDIDKLGLGIGELVNFALVRLSADSSDTLEDHLLLSHARSIVYGAAPFVNGYLRGIPPYGARAPRIPVCPECASVMFPQSQTVQCAITGMHDAETVWVCHYPECKQSYGPATEPVWLTTKPLSKEN